MSFLAGGTVDTGFTNPGPWWIAFAVAAGAGILVLVGFGISMFIQAGEGRDATVDTVTDCGVKGHFYEPHNAGWRCVTCGVVVATEDEVP
jgi:hypothetical protein